MITSRYHYRGETQKKQKDGKEKILEIFRIGSWNILGKPVKFPLILMFKLNQKKITLL